MVNSKLKKSPDYKSEYCCTIVKIGEVNPIEGKDRIGYTLVNGEKIVVRKDQVKEGDVLIYASNETQLNEKFLSANNLFEVSSYELNSNSEEVEPFVMSNRSLKKELEAIQKENNKLIRSTNFIMTYEAEYLAAEKDDVKMALAERFEKYCKYLNKATECELLPESTEKTTEDLIIAAQRLINTNDIKINSLKSQIDNNSDFIRSHVGFFNKTGRVRAIRLGGVRSMGYLFTIDELAKYNPNVKDINLSELIGEDFDTVEDELFVKAYVPFIPEKKQKSKVEKANKKIERFDRMINGEFSFHYDTQMFARNVDKFKPTDSVTISNKLHGTSGIFAKVHVKMPIKLPFHKWLWNKFVDLTGLFKSHRIIDYVVEYGNVTSSRKVIKNQYINKNVNKGYYSVDVWSEYGDLIYPYLEEGMTVYGEICGYETGQNKMIQKKYDYGCKIGENFLMPYRITTSDEEGVKKEWEVMDVYDWTVRLIESHPELKDKIHPITIFYHGTLGDLYPNLSQTEHWHTNVLEEMRYDTKHFGMEMNEPMCINKVPREGIVIRKDNDDTTEAFKLKCYKFLDAEAKQISDIEQGNGEVDVEMTEAYE